MIPTDFSKLDRLDWIFKAQMELTEKFLPIEMGNGRATADYPVDINSRVGQIVIKDFLWRITEEIVEALDSTDRTDRIEELADVLHFITELCLLIGVRLSEKGDDSDDRLIAITKHQTKDIGISDASDQAMLVISFLGKAGNLLKGRPWKREYPDTDMASLKGYIVNAYHAVIGMFVNEGLDGHGIFKAYFAKEAINQERLREKEIDDE